MEKFLVKGNTKLVGEVTIGGAKNAAVAIIPATILAKGRCVLENIPEISDVGILLRVISEMGGTVRYLDRTTVEIDTSRIYEPVVPHELARQLRGSYYFLGSLLGCYGKASVAMPGGCDLGVRPIDLHIKGLEALGASVTINHGVIEGTTTKPLKGAHIFLDFASVGATVNIMLGAVRAKGLTIIENAAKEPHVVDLANFLNSMGADVRGAGTDVIKIHGVDIMHGSTYAIIPDQIEAGTYMIAAAATGGNVLIKNIIPKHMEVVSSKLIRSGAEVIEYDDSIRVTRTKPLQATTLKTMPYPGFPTDLQSQMSTMLTRAKGTSIVTEGIFDNRFRYMDDLIRMGANIKVDGNVAVIQGVERLTAAPVKAPDLRGGISLLIAGLMAEGVTEIEDIYHIERGYTDVVEKFTNLGASIKRIEVPGVELSPAL